MLADDTVYTVSARSLDYAGNYSTTYATYTFTYDKTAPSVSVVSPADGGAYSAVKPVAINGTTSNSQSSVNTGVSTVTVQIVKDPNGVPTYFDGGSFVPGSRWLAAQGTAANWSYTNASLTWTNTTQYRIDAEATDYAGNAATINSATFVYDVEKRTSTVVYPLPGYTTGFMQISGTATDQRYGGRVYYAGLSSYTVNIAIKRLTAPAGWWSGSDFSSAQPVWSAANSNTTPEPDQFVYALPAGVTTYMTDSGHQNVSYLLVPWSYRTWRATASTERRRVRSRRTRTWLRREWGR